MSNSFDISEIEDRAVRYVRDTLKVSDDVFTNRPRTLDTRYEHFAVVRVSGVITDLSAYGKFNLLVSLFARNINGRKNSKRLSVMYEKLIAGLPADEGRLMLDGTPTVIGDTADDFDFHIRIIQIKTIIKIKQQWQQN